MNQDNQVAAPAIGGRCTVESALYLRKRYADGREEDYGCVSRRLVTAVGVKWVTDLLAGTAAGSMKYHAPGTNNTAEAVGDTALGTEIESRVAGTQVSATSGNNATYTTAATITFTGTHSVVEHGIFSAAAAGTLFDRSVFTAKPVTNGDQLTFTYVFTLNSGG